jgi:hypothetical protein
MQNRKRNIFIIVLVYVSFVSVAWAEVTKQAPKDKPPSTWELIQKARQKQPDSISDKNNNVTELLNKFLENHNEDKLNSFIIKTESLIDYDNRLLTARTDAEKRMAKRFTGKRKKRIHGDYRYDGHLVSNRREIWRQDAIDNNYNPMGKSYYECDLFDGKRRLRFSRSRINSQRNVLKVQQDVPATAAKIHALSLSIERYLLGVYTIGGRNRRQLDEIIKEADSAVVRDKCELVAGSECYVIDVVEDKTKWSFWIDPEHGYNVSKSECLNIGYRGTETAYSGEVIRYERKDNIWIPMESVLTRYRKYWTGVDYEKTVVNHRITEIVLNPDHEALGSFIPDYIPNGTKAHIYGIPYIRYTWQDGKIIDANGTIIVDCSNKRALERK